MTVTASGLRAGLIVIGSDGDRLGQIKEVGEREVRVDVRLAPDVAVPLADFEAVVGGLAILRVPAAAVAPPPERYPEHL